MTPTETWLLVTVGCQTAMLIALGRYALGVRRIAIQAQQDAHELELQQADIELGLRDPRLRRKKLTVIQDEGVRLATRYGRKPR